VRLDVNSEVRGNEGGLWMIDDCENTILVEGRCKLRRAREGAEVRCKFWLELKGCCSHYQFSLKKYVLKGR
jgi:hypothetical protein